mmetsp:Transcript_32740/g.48483  ORF Transcript_32740/g.48483 Transcript_32740/m.48483 type:complete len:340 (+) Transcript_32740:182-1201(+)|eukprot:CAMPEP_0194201862 /NCGR_PEP_ID=MMETSP0156-20130528/2024_1 /TAXON_ID=33649 /ORGANISM="Thalassionema nitzschioides, Strain L26-B" /LENGTH=339 /DNA_ID=CAMNT_0038927167 /DNA_START=142 /DNA_END=1161 /DNA_ORIENTATION=-
MTKVPPVALVQLLSPDGYYTYLGIKKKPPTDSDPTPTLDEDQIKKNYRRLSLRHHPDRPTGDADTFRVLNRAQKVLSNAKLRQQYDLLGLDLEDDEEEKDEANSKEDDGEQENEGQGKPSNSPDGVMSQIASITLAVIFQVIVRTIMMGGVSILVVRYRITLIPALLFLVFIAYRIHSIAKQNNTVATSSEMMSPVMIGLGLVLMYRGRMPDWTWTFWAGEALVMIMFVYNSIPEKSSILSSVVAFVATLLTLWLRGNVWKYVTLVGLEVFVAVVAALAFPVMEMILEQILNEKLRKVGEKVRAHSIRLDLYYNQDKTKPALGNSIGKEANSTTNASID